VFQDQVLTCRDCGREFVFSVSEQEFFAEKGFTNSRRAEAADLLPLCAMAFLLLGHAILLTYILRNVPG
jgi:hypothetical protein